MNKILFVVLLFTSALFSNTLQAQLKANNDNTIATPGVKKMIDVLSNDNLGACSPSQIETSMAVVTNPAKGTVVKENGAFYYTPNTTAASTDVFTYKITCGSLSSTGTVNIQMGTYPGNILPDQCSRNPGGFDFSMKELYRSSVATSNYFPAIVGDLDKDGNAEIVIPAIDGSTHNVDASYSKIYILNHQSQVKYTITLPTETRFNTNVNPVIGDFDNDGYGEILVPGNIGTRKLFIFDYKGVKKAEIAISAGMARTIGMADFNRDGYPEIYVGTSIYQYKGGVLTLLIAGNPALNTMAQDIDKDGIPELVAANATYKVNLTAGTVTSSATCASAIVTSGNTFAVADIDLDGQIEVVSLTADSGVGANKKVTITVWNPLTGATRYSITTAVITVATRRAMATSWPFIGDTDGNLYPDIVFMGGSNEQYKTYVYRIEYNRAYIDLKFMKSTLKLFNAQAISIHKSRNSSLNALI